MAWKDLILADWKIILDKIYDICIYMETCMYIYRETHIYIYIYIQIYIEREREKIYTYIIYIYIHCGFKAECWCLRVLRENRNYIVMRVFMCILGDGIWMYEGI